MADIAFSKKTFTYFDGALLNVNDREWFESNRGQYEEHVEIPLTHLVLQLKHELSASLPGIEFSVRKISKPLLRKTEDESGPALRDKATAFFSELATSMFEMNPGIYLSFGAKAEDDVIGCGLYMPSSRQFKELRPKLCADFQTLSACLENKRLNRYWAGLVGDRHKRFPKGFDENDRSAKYLRHKQFFLGKDLTREDVLRSDFIETTSAAMKAAVPFLQWTREAVGIYRAEPRRDVT